MEDLAGLGKIAEVILQAVGKTIGSVLEPWQTKRVEKAKADAGAYALVKKAEAEWRAELIREEHLSADDAQSFEVGYKRRLASWASNHVRAAAPWHRGKCRLRQES